MYHNPKAIDSPRKPSKAKTLLFFSIIVLTSIITSCQKTKSVYLKNKTQRDIEIIYDDRVYRSQSNSERTLAKKILESDSAFFIGPDSSTANIFPDYLQINQSHDTIILIGRRAIKSMINGESSDKYFITIN